jgi:hypothetical protein
MSISVQRCDQCQRPAPAKESHARITPEEHIAILEDMERLMEMVRAIEVADRVLEEPTLTPRPTGEDLRA